MITIDPSPAARDAADSWDAGQYVEDVQRDLHDENRVWGFMNAEEYYAVLIENMYRSERRMTLRMTYLGNERARWTVNRSGIADPMCRDGARMGGKLRS